MSPNLTDAHLRTRNYAPDSVSLANLRVLVQWRSKVQQIISSLSTFGNELVQFVAFSNEFLKDADDNIGKEHFLYRLIIDTRVKCSFPNVEIALRSTDFLWSQTAVVSVRFQS